jgi:hypothetical protein
MMARGRRPHAIDRVRRDLHRGREAEREVRPVDVVVDGLGDADAADAPVDERLGAGHRAIAPDDNQRLQPVLLDDRHALICPILDLRRAVGQQAARELARVGLVGRPEDGASLEENAGDIPRRERADAVLDQPEEAVLDADGLDAVRRGILHHSADDSIEAGAVAAARENADAGDGWHKRMVDPRESNG